MTFYCQTSKYEGTGCAVKMSNEIPHSVLILSCLTDREKHFLWINNEYREINYLMLGTEYIFEQNEL